MTKEVLLKRIAESAYNVGFGAKKHFATYDITSKVPGIIEFLSLAIGVLALCFDVVSTKIVSTCLIIFGIVSIYISKYNESQVEYSKAASELTQIFNSMKDLYYEVKSKEHTENLDTDISKLKELEERFYRISKPKQIILSDWFAHYKFFWQWRTHIKWLVDELSLTTKDKIPLSFVVICTFMFVGLLILVFFDCIVVFWSLLINFC
jgi:hypothetical protein